ncbi:adenylyl-sulfate kinase (plasmid) [Brevundimonas staleyi]|uniref:adenylyl-sulfate kinase n=1 Tax=Brevundimonas staleyi TaxID=74326 RepID=UPI0035A5EE73
MTYWVTGRSGSGKTTLAQALTTRLTARGRPVIQLDGDRMREILGQGYSHEEVDRRQLAAIYGKLCREISGQGSDVVCSTVSMFHAAHQWNRENLPRYVEIYLRVPIPILAQRHPKGLYARGLAGHIRNVPGVDQTFEEPIDPDVLIEDDGSKTAAVVAEELFRHLHLEREAA